MVVQTTQTEGDYIATQSVQVADFIYSPPPAAQRATRILVKPNLGYPKGPPVTVSMSVLAKVLQGLRHASPQAEILVVEGVCSKISLTDIAGKNGLFDILDSGMTLLDADTLPCVPYPNLSPAPVRYSEMWAPKLLQEVDCRISVSAFKVTSLKEQPLVSATLKNLYGLFPRAKYKARSNHSRGQLHRPSVPQILRDVYFSVGHLFDGGVADCSQKFISKDWRPDVGEGFAVGQVVWGGDLLAIDQQACKVAKEPVANYLEPISQIRASA
ncbi:MAG: DUF362 domain-containing protein [Leptolyngbya sp. SIO3F4]|nr:DUF362 domain-containing protein [Leptolyngbya sp. SIO3F4]